MISEWGKAFSFFTLGNWGMPGADLLNRCTIMKLRESISTVRVLSPWERLQLWLTRTSWMDFYFDFDLALKLFTLLFFQVKVRSVLRPSQFGGQPCTEPLVTFQPCIPSKLCKIEETDCKNKFLCDSGNIFY